MQHHDSLRQDRAKQLKQGRIDELKQYIRNASPSASQGTRTYELVVHGKLLLELASLLNTDLKFESGQEVPLSILTRMTGRFVNPSYFDLRFMGKY